MLERQKKKHSRIVDHYCEIQKVGVKYRGNPLRKNRFFLEKILKIQMRIF